MNESDKTRSDFERACKTLEEVLAGKRPRADGKAAFRAINNQINALNADNRQKRAELKS